MVNRTDWLDWYVADGGSAVFAGGQVIVLSELATVLVDLVGDGATVHDLADGLARRFGHPEEQDLLAETRARVRELVAAGVLTDSTGDKP